MPVFPYVVKSDCTVRGTFVRHGTVVELDITGGLATEYGLGNLTPLSASESGSDDADHSAIGN